MMRLLFAVSCLCCWAASVQAQTLLVLGDSLSAGYQMQAEQSWPALLNEKWRQQGGEHTLINASISGETTQGGLARLPALLETHKPDWVLIELGANDGLRGFAPAITRANLTKMIELTRAHQAKTVLTQILLPRNYGARPFLCSRIPMASWGTTTRPCTWNRCGMRVSLLPCRPMEALRALPATCSSCPDSRRGREHGFVSA